MSYVTNVLPAVMTILQGLDLGKLNNRPRNSEFIETHKDLFADTEEIFRGAWVDRTAAPSKSAIAVQVFRNHQIVIEMYRAIDDANESSNLFQATIDEVLTTFEAMIELAANIHQIGMPQLLEKSEEMFGGVLCHRAKIQITIQEETTP